jgi:hypothetical protein
MGGGRAAAHPPGEQAGSFAPQFSRPGETAMDDPVWVHKRQRLLNEARQKSLVEDTNKLLKLAAELNAEAAGENPASPPAMQFHKLAEIEKLAHSVKDKMSTPLWGEPAVTTPRMPFSH